MADTEDDVVMRNEDEEETKDEEKEKSTKDKRKEKPKDEKLTHLSIPLARVKKIMKLDKDVKLISSDAALLIAKATEYFIEYFVKQGYNITKEEKRKILNYKDLASVVKEIDSFEFLADIIPEKRIFKSQTETTTTKTKKTKDEVKDEKDEVKDEDKDEVKDEEVKDESSKSDNKKDDQTKGKKGNITKYFAVKKDENEAKEDDN